MNREFLERSLTDLDREYAAGDLERVDYERLRADYERRLRGEGPPPRPPARRSLVLLSVAFVVLVAVAAGVLVARAAGRREDGRSITGGDSVPSASTPATIPAELARCRPLEGGEAIDCYTAYTEANPDDPDGFMEFGLFAVNAGLAAQRTELLNAGESFLRRALDIDPGHLPARTYLAVLLERTDRAEEAAAECERLAAADVPAELTQLVDLAC